MVFQCINIRQVPWEVLKTAAAFGLGFQHLPRYLANVNAWKPMFDAYILGFCYHFVGQKFCCELDTIYILPSYECGKIHNESDNNT